MNRKLFIQFILFLILALFATYRLGFLQNFRADEQQINELKEMRKNVAALEGLKTTESAMYQRLEQAQSRLADVSTVYLPDPEDPYSWAARRISYLADRAEVRINDVQGGPGPRLRAHRGEDTRQFSIYRATVECTGTADQILAFARIAEERNPFVVLSGLTISPKKEGDSRIGLLLMDWPSWRTTDLRNELLSELELIPEPAPPDSE